MTYSRKGKNFNTSRERKTRICVFLRAVKVNSNHDERLKTRMSFFIWPSLFSYNSKVNFKLLRRSQRKTTEKILQKSAYRSSCQEVFCEKDMISVTSEVGYNVKVLESILRSSHQRCFVKKGVLRNVTKFTGKHLRQNLFFNKVGGVRSFLIKL